MRVAASAGVATLLEDETVESWLQRTDDALYYSKEQGRNCAHRMQGKKPSLIELASEETEVPDPDMLSFGDGDSEDGTVLRAIEGNGVFASLANRSSLEKSFNDIRSRTQEAVSVHLMVVMCAPGLLNSSIRSILQVVRMPLRSVDRIGAIDDSTLLVCMPSADAEFARQRGEQICHSIASLGIKHWMIRFRQFGSGLQKPPLAKILTGAFHVHCKRQWVRAITLTWLKVQSQAD